MLASQLRHHPARTAAELAADLTAASDRLSVMRAENLSVAAAFDLSYADLTETQQRLFRRLGLVPGGDFDGYAAAALDDRTVECARRTLDELYDHHLLAEPARGRYVLHDLLREHARSLAAATEQEARSAADRLMSYYAHTATAACKHIATWTTTGGRPAPGRSPSSSPLTATSEQAAAWLESERPNLRAAVNYAAAEAMPQYAIAIASATGGFLRARGHWGLAADLYQTALTAACESGDLHGAAGALDELGLLQQLTGDYGAATANLTHAADLFGELGDQRGQAYAINHLGLVEQDTGDYSAAAAHHRSALAIARDARDQLAEAVSLIDLGLVQQLTGDYAAAVASYEHALPLVRSSGSAFDEADALCELGAAQRMMGDYQTAGALVRRSLEMFRHLGDRLGQAWALDELGLVQQQTGDYLAAAASVAEAIDLFRDLGDRRGLAMALNSLGELTTRTSAFSESREHHARAFDIAGELGARLEQARALEGTGRSLLSDNTEEAAVHLRRALAVYEEIGAPGARRIRDALNEHGP
jgi:tetratricopeptide (TPR) repeat protein